MKKIMNWGEKCILIWPIFAGIVHDSEWCCLQGCSNEVELLLECNKRLLKVTFLTFKTYFYNHFGVSTNEIIL